MTPDGMQYRAVRVIYYGSARAYNEGDLVHAAAVLGSADPGGDAWLSIGPDVVPVEGVKMPVPARNAPTAAWEAWAVSDGMDPEQAAGMARREFIELAEHGGQEGGDE